MSKTEELDELAEILDDLTHFGAGPSAFYPVTNQGPQAPNPMSRPTSLTSLSSPNSPNGPALEQISPQGYASVPQHYAMVYTPMSAPASPAEGQNTIIVAGQEQSSQICAICGDRGTGKHYGANSCDGCKGFFRRTIRRNRDYNCRFSQDCIIDKDHRNACRYCRFQKCLRAGMKPEAVQNERDRISPKRPAKRSASAGGMHDTMMKVASQETPSEESKSQMTSPYVTQSDYINMLMSAEAICNQLRTTVITSTDSPSDTLPFRSISLEDKTQLKTASLDDVSESMRQQLLLMVEWAKTLPPFTAISMEEQIALLRNFAAQFLMLAVGWRSLLSNGAALYLNNETIIPRDPPEEIPDVNHVTTRVLDELVAPMNLIDLDESEYVSLKGIIFFNPICKGVNSSMAQVRETRHGIMSALQRYVATKCPDQPLRFGNLLLLLPPLQAIAQSLIEDIQLASLFGMTRIDSLLTELMLPEVDSGKRVWMFANLQKSSTAAKWPKLAAAARSAAASPSLGAQNEQDALRAARRALSLDSSPMVTNGDFTFKTETQ